MRTALISFYLRNSTLCHLHTSKCKIQHLRSITTGSPAATAEQTDEEEPWVEPYKKALPEKST